MDDKNRQKAIDLALASIEKEYGKGAIMRLGEDQKAPEVMVVPTGSLALAIALGVAVVGGLAFSQLVTLYVTPVFYTYLDELQSWFGQLRKAKPGVVVADPVPQAAGD